MATQTTNLNLTKPDTSEKLNVSVLNTNWDLLDAAIGKHRCYSYTVTSNGTRTVTMNHGIVFVFRSAASLAAVGLIDQWSGVTMLHTNTNISITCSNHVVTVTNSGSAVVNMLVLYTT